ncbi:MAG TPA: hypothetical protein DCS93_13565 [Microscillaceae bacterium]|nr:hypothetical protein [Microscillaceae bacterium]
MDTNPILSNRFIEGHLDQEKSLLTVHWFPSTYDLKVQEYKDIVLEIADLIREKRIKHWMGYSKDFAFVITPELQEWISGEFNQKLIEGGLQKMAIIIPADYIANLSVQQAVGEMEKRQQEGDYQTRYFDNPEQAEAWLMEA